MLVVPPLLDPVPLPPAADGTVAVEPAFGGCHWATTDVAAFCCTTTPGATELATLTDTPD